MRLNEYFRNKDIWNKVKTKGDFIFIDDTFEILFLIKYGQRTLFSSIEDLDGDLLADVIVNAFKKKWDSLLDIEVENILAGESQVYSKEEITDNDWTDGGSVTNQVSAFNDDELVTDDKQLQDSNRNLTGTVTTTYRTDNIKIKDALENLGILENLEVKEQAMNDVVSLIALEIYK